MTIIVNIVTQARQQVLSTNNSTVVSLTVNSHRLYWANLFSLWPPCVIGGPLYFCPVVSFYLLSFFFYLFFIPRLISASTDWMSIPYFYTWRGPIANLECRSEMCGTRLAANAGPKKVAKNRHLGTIPQLCRAISSQLRHVSTIGKKTC